MAIILILYFPSNKAYCCFSLSLYRARQLTFICIECLIQRKNCACFLSTSFSIIISYATVMYLILFIMHSQWINENRHAIYGLKWMNKVYMYVCYTLLKDLFDHKKGQIRIHCIWSNWSNRNWNRRMEMIWANCSMTDVLKLS